MDMKLLCAVILAFISAVNGVCDRNALTEANCMQYADTTGSTSITEQCNSWKQISDCIEPFRATCSDDQSFLPYKTMETGLKPLCSGGGCTIFQCDQMNKYQVQGSQLQATPEVCQAVTEFKTCVMTAKSSGQCEQSMIDAYDQTVSTFTMMCGGCDPNKMRECAKLIESVQSEEFVGFPSKQQLDLACPNLAQFKTCIQPVREKCASGQQNEITMKIVKGIDASMKLADFLCAGDYKTDFLKYGQECFDKPAYKNETKMCEKFISPSTGTDGQPKSETQDEMCSRMQNSMQCYTTKVENVCGEEVKTFVEKVENIFYNIIAEPLNCPTSGSPKMTVQFGMLLALLLTALLMY